MEVEGAEAICFYGYGAVLEEKKCDFFRWYDREYSDYQLMFLNDLRRELNELRNEQNEDLVQAGEARAEADVVRIALGLMPNEIKLLRAVHKELNGDIQFIGEEQGLFTLEMKNVKNQLKDVKGRYAAYQKAIFFFFHFWC
ncbi:conserved hypothetical protein [Ricinus communis]|uniref:Uncharacterized protein n=1 Tax=Ricinus communis TaxID=3988 RepID=B9SJ94_RICCO|nr:conserved hypothetical protein [Ricinus communis]